MTDKTGMIEWFLNELPQLKRSEVLSGEEEKKLDRYYQQRLAQMPKPTAYYGAALAILGAALIIGGAVTVLQFYWAVFPKAVQIGISAFPLLVGAILSFYTIFSDRGRGWKEVSALCSAAGSITLIGMVAQIYQLQYSFGEFTVLAILLALPAIYIFNSITLTTLTALGMFCTLGSFPEYGGLVQFALLALLMPFVFYHVEEPVSSYRAYMRYLILFCALFGVLNSTLLSTHFEFPVIAVCASFLLAGWNLYEKKVSFRRNPWVFAGFFPLLLLLGTGSSMEWLWLGDFSKVTMLQRWNYWLFSGFTLLVFIVQWPRRALDAKRVVLLLLVLLGAGGFFLNAPVMELAANIYMGIFGIVFLIKGMLRRQLLTFNGGSLMLLVLFGCRIFDPSISVLIRGCGFIILGAGFLFGNWLFAITHKREAEL